MASRLLALGACFLIFLAAGAIAPAPGASAQGETAAEVVTIGVLVDQSGLRMTAERGIEAALRVAADEINAHFERTGEPLRIALRIGDTRSDPDHALLQLQAMVQEGVKIVIGPTTSAEAYRVRPFAQSQGILLISPSSTAPSLAIPGDLLYRMVPDDTAQGRALADKMWRDGIRAVVPLRRSDLYSQDLVDFTKQAFESRDASRDFGADSGPIDSNCDLGDDEESFGPPAVQVCGGVVYNPRTSDFISEVQTLSDVVSEAVRAYGARRVAVLLIAFDESVSIFMQAAKSPVLSLVRWYGADGTAKVSSIVSQPEAARFAADVGYTASLFAEPQNDAFTRLSEASLAAYGVGPDAYAATAYDALWLVARAMAMDGVGHDPKRVAENLSRAAEGYQGASGPIRFNGAGDRDMDQYDFWQVRGRPGAYEWARVR